MQAKLFTDGGSRGNPGDAGLGFVLSGSGFLVEAGWYIGHATNNVAEYSALIWGLQNALEHKVDTIEIYADSELMVKQLNGDYKVKNAGLKPLFNQAQSLLKRFLSSQVKHVYREDNQGADALANAAMDNQGPVGNFIVPWKTEQQSLFDEEIFESRPYEEEINQEESDPMIERNLNYEGAKQLSGNTFENKQGRYSLTVKDHFDAAHMLKDYPGPCRYLHGHTWEVEVTISGAVLDDVGILYDFKDIKRDIKSILENFDHRYLNDVAPFDMVNPTAEHLARIIYHELESVFPDQITLDEVAIWESPAARLSYRKA